MNSFGTNHITDFHEGDDQILYRDTSVDHHLVTLGNKGRSSACE